MPLLLWQLFHISKQRLSFRVDGMEHQQWSKQTVVTKLQGLDEMHTETALATTLILAFIGKRWGGTPRSHIAA
jgi:hypothetical protein